MIQVIKGGGINPPRVEEEDLIRLLSLLIHPPQEVLQGNGFTASAVGYTMFALASLLAPTIVGWKGPRSSFILVSLFYFSLFTQVCHVLRRLLVHSIYRPAASPKVKMI